MTSIAIRSKLSKLVTKDELGKVFSLLATLESITPLIASLFFTYLFKWSLNFFPGLTFEVCAALMIIPLLSMIWIDLKTVQI
jgi:PCFT/HCP family folate transporter-like MFS transporter 1/3